MFRPSASASSTNRRGRLTGGHAGFAIIEHPLRSGIVEARSSFKRTRKSLRQAQAERYCGRMTLAPETDIVPDSERRGLMGALPAVMRPYASLIRLDRPIGAWLLFWPCAWGVALAGMGGGGRARVPLVAPRASGGRRGGAG